MALQSSGAISLNNVNVELGNSGTAPINMGSSAVRDLFGVASGAIAMSDGYGASAVTGPVASFVPALGSAKVTTDNWVIRIPLRADTGSGYAAYNNEAIANINGELVVGGFYAVSPTTGATGYNLHDVITGQTDDGLLIINNIPPGYEQIQMINTVEPNKATLTTVNGQNILQNNCSNAPNYLQNASYGFVPIAKLTNAGFVPYAGVANFSYTWSSSVTYTTPYQPDKKWQVRWRWQVTSTNVKLQLVNLGIDVATPNLADDAWNAGTTPSAFATTAYFTNYTTNSTGTTLGWDRQPTGWNGTDFVCGGTNWLSI